MKIDVRKLISRLLLGFVLISIGFALGKETAARRAGSPGDAAPGLQQAEAGEKVIVYYMHATIRCVTCNQIEQMAAKLVNSAFAEEMEAGRLVWQEVNFQENTELAERFDIVASCIVVAKTEDGKLIDHKRLDDVWTLAGKPEQFNRYIADAILGYLRQGGE